MEINYIILLDIIEEACMVEIEPTCYHAFLVYSANIAHIGYKVSQQSVIQQALIVF